MGKIISKCCKIEDEPSQVINNEKEEIPKKIHRIFAPEKEVFFENLDKSSNPINQPKNDSSLKQEPVFLEHMPRSPNQIDKNLLIKQNNEETESVSKETITFQQKSNNFQVVSKLNNKSTKNSESLIQELREIQKSQIALIKSKQHFLPNQIDEDVENEDKQKKVTDIFNNTRIENEEPERPPKIDELAEDEEINEKGIKG